MFDLQTVGQDYGVQFLNYTIRWQMSKFTNFSLIIALALTVSDIYTFLIVDLQKTRSRSRRSIFEIIPFDGKCQNPQISRIQLCASSYRFRDVKILNV